MAIWDNPSKVQGRWGADKTKLYTASSYKCPNCASNLVYDAKQGAMVCKNCGGLFDPDTLESVGSFAMLNPERDYDGTIEISKEDEGRVEIVCNSCGAEIVTDKNTSSTFCAFCGSPALVTRRLTREFKPDMIIPFKFDKEKAISIYEKHCEGINHLPKDFKSKKLLSTMSGIYVPAWLISSEVEVKVCGKGLKGKMVDYAYSIDHQSDEHNFEHLTYGKVNLKLKNVPFDGEIKIPDRVFAAAEPFDYSELEPFRSEFLQGFVAEKYDLQPLDMTDRIYNRLDKYSLEVCRKISFGYDDFQPNSDASTTRYYNQSIIYALLPCWFLSVEYEGCHYQYIVNGQTGKVSGEFPYAKGWESIEKTGRFAKMEAISLNGSIRKLLYLLPTIAYAAARVFFSGSYRSYGRLSRFYSLFEHPFEVLLACLGIGGLVYLCVEILPKILRNKEKDDLASLSASNPHELAKELGVAEYFDTSYPVTAHETTQDFIPIDFGWKYGEQQEYDYKTAKPDVEEVALDENSTEFEKKGFNRDMLRDRDNNS